MATLNIALVGPMGAGKSTIGRVLASLLKLPFKDTDRVIEDRTGADIPWIFDVEGEEGFRNRESAVLEELLQERGAVVATGGGIVLRESNRKILATRSTVVYLTASIEQLIERTYKDKKRPLLHVEDPKQKIIELINLRDSMYREIAEHIVTTDGRAPKIVAQEIAALLN